MCVNNSCTPILNRFDNYSVTSEIKIHIISLNCRKKMSSKKFTDLTTILKISFLHEQPILKQNYFSVPSGKQEAKFTNDLPERRNFN